MQSIQLHDLHFVPYISEAEIQKRLIALGTTITNDYKGKLKAPILIGILNGSFMFLADLARVIDLTCELTFMKVSSYDGTSSTGKILKTLDLSIDIAERDVIIVEDIIDTGKTMFYLLEYLEQFEPASIRIASLLTKPDALQYDIKIDYLGFSIPDKFVVGYGLDYNEMGRNLKDIYRSCLKTH